MAARLGLRFEYATVVPPKIGVGGYVKFTSSPRSATQIVASLYSTLASRSLERIFLSNSPLSEKAVSDITPGPSADIEAATVELFNAIYKLGFDPKGGVINRAAVRGNGYGNFEDVPPEQVEKLGLILRNMEDKMTADLLLAHSREWYIEKISKFAQLGGVTEKEFFKIIEYAHPGNNNFHPGEKSPIYDAFAHIIQQQPKEVEIARTARNSADGLTIVERMSAFKNSFYDLVETHLHLSAPEKLTQTSASPPKAPSKVTGAGALRCAALFSGF
mgnify:CR=1 FL=1